MPATSLRIKQLRDSVDLLRPDFPEHAFLLLGAGLLLSTGDYHTLWRDSVLDGSDDKKIDFFHIDRDTGRALLIQAYERQDWSTRQPPSNKASDLNTAFTWLLDAPLATIARNEVRAAAEDLRDSLNTGVINELAVYFLHNGLRNPNADKELAAIRASLESRLAHWPSQSGNTAFASAHQLGLDELCSLEDSRHAAISVNETVTLPTINQASIVNSDMWNAATATVKASDVVALAQRYGEELTSANIRDYLGRRTTSRNINQQIRATAREEPQNFWVFNNGLTLITKSFDVKQHSLECNGLAVTNGAQTLGSLSDVADNEVLDQVRIQVRVIASKDPSLVEKIIRFNNTQNPIKPWELRVLDPVQARLETEFRQSLGITYQFRRGTGRSSIQNVHLSKLAQWLDAFNGNPVRAHRNSRDLFEHEPTYRSLFNDQCDVRHLLAVYRLGEAVGATKDKYKILVTDQQANTAHQELYGYFRYGAFTTAVIYLASEVLLELLGGGSEAKARILLADMYEGDREGAIVKLQQLIEFIVVLIPDELRDSDGYAELRSETGINKLRSRILANVRQWLTLQPKIVSALSEALQLADNGSNR